MNADLERLARAHYEAGHDPHASPTGGFSRWATWEELQQSEEIMERYEAQVRALLTELAKPSEGMRDTMIDLWASEDRESQALKLGVAYLSFTAMINHILADGGETP